MRRSQVVLILTGMTLYWPLLRRNVFFILFSGHHIETSETAIWYCLFLACAVSVLALCVALRDRFSSLTQKYPQILLTVFIVKASVKTLALVAVPTETEAQIMLIADIVLSAMAYILLGFMWATKLSSLSEREGILVASSSFLLSFLVQLAIAQSTILSSIFVVLIPLVSALCWFAAGVDTRATERITSVPSSTSSYRAPTFILLIVAFLFAGSILRGVFPGQSAFTSGAFLQEGSSIVFSLIIFLLCFFLSPQTRLFRILWTILTIAFFAGLFLMVVISPNDYLAARQLVVMGRTCLFLLLLMMLLSWVRQEALSPITVFGLYFILVDILSSFIGYVVAPYYVQMSGVSLRDWSVYFSLGIAFVLIIASLIFLTARTTAYDPPPPMDMSNSPISAKKRTRSVLRPSVRKRD